MRASPLTQTNSAVVLKHERRRNMHAEVIIRKVVRAIITVAYWIAYFSALQKTIREFHASIPQFYPSGGSYNRELTEQKLLPEGKAYLNN